ncbi:MAG: geranylgeranyl reductase family protein [Candidatus Rokuibacteriota bacterium]
MVAPASPWDVCIVGAGPAGSTCAYYLAGRGRRVLLLERERFPRDKLCGDAVTGRAQVHLERMGVLADVLAAGEGHWAEIGGFVSPRGVAYIGSSVEDGRRPLVIAIKRVALDVRLARAAASAGATLVEDSPVAGADFAPGSGVWTVRCATQPATTYEARALVTADGALARLARSLGVVTTAPDGVCSRAYVEAGTTDFASDGVMFYPRELLPGYCVLFREAGGELNLCCYVIPGGQAGLRDLKRLHDKIVRGDPYVNRALGPRARLAPMRAAPLRLGGVPQSVGDHMLVIGDAAGHIDPLTGEGIQYAMDGGEIAAQTLDEALEAHDLSAAFLQRYQDRWMASFGWDFRWSWAMAAASARYPAFLDGCAALMRRRGTEFLLEWAEAMTGARPKRTFLRPRVALPILGEMIRLWWRGPVPVTEPQRL